MSRGLPVVGTRSVVIGRSSRAAAALLLLAFLAVPSLHAQLSTDDHLAEPGFWPTQPAASRSGYTGSAACRACHAAKVASQAATPMALTLMKASDSLALHSHPDLGFGVTHYKYRIKTAANGSVYSVSDGTDDMSVRLLWAFGTPRVGQSYLFKRGDEKFYEARVTYFERLRALEFTPTRALLSPKNISEAMYREVGAAEVGRCFACHSTASTVAGKFDENNLIPGVTCEACHGPGAEHVAVMEAGASQASAHPRSAIYNSGSLSPSDSVDFCGACHGTWWDVKLSGVKGVSTARSAPYRLETSKCWGNGDARLTCVACHDPHQQLQTETAAYDAVCKQCHAAALRVAPTADHPGKRCPVATSKCSSCHMPKVYVPEMHDNFTDHRIRVVRVGEAFPE